MTEFVITVIETLAVLLLAVQVYRARPLAFLNRVFSAFLVFLSLWILCGYPHAVIQNPGRYFVTMEFRLAHCFASLAAGAFFLFCLTFYLGHKPRRAWINGVALAGAIMAFCSLSDLFIREVSYSSGTFHVVNGYAYTLFPLYMLAAGASSFFLIGLKRHKALSTDRARATYILLGFGIFFLLAFLLAVIVPNLAGTDTTSNYPFLLAIIPIIFTTYAILKHQLLDVRLAVRRSFAYILTLFLFGTPLVVLYAVFRARLSSYSSVEIVVSVITLALAVAFSPALLRWSNRLASRFLFAGLYDEIDLLHQVSTIFTSTVNVREGLAQATALACRKLGLSRLLAVIPDEVTKGQGTWISGTTWTGEEFKKIQFTSREPSPLFGTVPAPVILENHRPPHRAEGLEDAFVREMRVQGFRACFPLKSPKGSVGHLLVGDKINRTAFDPIDVDFLGQFAERAGLFVENYLLSAYLLTQFEELMDTKRKLEESDRFKTDIITVTSHELRTPLTILNGFAFMLRDHYERFSEEERKQYLAYITSSCERLSSILDQFLTVSYFQKGTVQADVEPIPLQELFEEIRSAFVPEQGKRIKSEVRPFDARVLTDHSYLSLMLRNLVENALRFSPDDMPVILRAEEKGEEVRVVVKDFGKGIDSPDVETIFEPFTRLEDTDKHQVGTGLGLYIVRLIADLLKIKVEVESDPGSGTTFSFRLPRT